LKTRRSGRKKPVKGGRLQKARGKKRGLIAPETILQREGRKELRPGSRNK